MTHIPGHIDVETTSFGALHMVKLPADQKGSTEHLRNFPLLLLPSVKVPKPIKNDEVGFHPYIVPTLFKGAMVNVVFASDLANWKDHENAEVELRKVLKTEPYKHACEALDVDPDKVESIEELHGPRTKLIDMAARHEHYGKYPNQRQVLTLSSLYMRTTNFRDLYLYQDASGKTKTRKTHQVIDEILKTADYTVTGMFIDNGKLVYRPAR